MLLNHIWMIRKVLCYGIMHRQLTILRSADSTQSTLLEAESCTSEALTHDIYERQPSFWMIRRQSISDDEGCRYCTPEVNPFLDDDGNDRSVAAIEKMPSPQQLQEVHANLSIDVESCKNTPQKQGVDLTFAKLSSEEE